MNPKILSGGSLAGRCPAGFVVTFAADETVWTESSHKYTRPEIAKLAVSCGFRTEAQWGDEEWLFAESLLVAV
jgi:uncharacterized SAM-dependent methyltransferase